MYIAIEGVDNVGKTTIIKKIKPILNRFVKDNKLPRIVYIAETEIETPPYLETKEDKSVYLAMKYALQRIKILNSVPSDKILISDRSVFSSYAYQGIYVPYNTLKQMNKCIKYPDYVILIQSDNGYYKDYDARYINAFTQSGVNFTKFSEYDTDLPRKICSEILRLLTQSYSFKFAENWLLNYNYFTEFDIYDLL